MKFVQFSTTLMLLCVLVAGCGNDTTSDDAADNTNVAQEGSEGVNVRPSPDCRRPRPFDWPW